MRDSLDELSSTLTAPHVSRRVLDDQLVSDATFGLWICTFTHATSCSAPTRHQCPPHVRDTAASIDIPGCASAPPALLPPPAPAPSPAPAPCPPCVELPSPDTSSPLSEPFMFVDIVHTETVARQQFALQCVKLLNTKCKPCARRSFFWYVSWQTSFFLAAVQHCASEWRRPSVIHRSHGQAQIRAARPRCAVFVQKSWQAHSAHCRAAAATD